MYAKLISLGVDGNAGILWHCLYGNYPRGYSCVPLGNEPRDGDCIGGAYPA